ncbi:pyridoxal-dependent decarboxylase [Actinoplanes sp. NPDC026623]|uniref:pyridoxal-dependent decarboxylase n=1 Tax=Actinoplanes sp. NPDC026623 TaxID=3155610 RepID=UPI0033D74D04
MTVPDLTLPAIADRELPLNVQAALFGSQVAADRRYHLAFPGATDRTYPDLAAILTSQLLNNVGDPWTDGHGRNHTKPYEIDVVRRLGRLFSGDEHVWGYVASGATEGTIHAIDEAATAYPDLVVYASTAAHYSVAKAARLVRAPLVHIRTDIHGRISLDHLRDELTRLADRPAAIVATVGTTEHEAVDDVAAITGLCDDLQITRRRIHVDAALAGIPLALLPDTERPTFGFDAGATSVVISGHKFLSTLMPCAVIVYPHRPPTPVGGDVAYIGTSDTTIAGSRSGHTPLLLYWSLTTGGGLDGHRRRAHTARELAAYTYDRLRGIGWAAQWQPPAFTVTLAQPARDLPQPWVLGGDQKTGRIICMPGMRQDWIDEFLSDLTSAHPGRTVIPMPRRGAALDPEHTS